MKIFILINFFYMNLSLAQYFSPGPDRRIAKLIIKKAYEQQNPNLEIKKIKYSWKRYGEMLLHKNTLAFLTTVDDIADIFKDIIYSIKNLELTRTEIDYYGIGMIEFQVFNQQTNTLRGFVNCGMFNLEYPESKIMELELFGCHDHNHHWLREAEFKSIVKYENSNSESITFSKLEFSKN